MANKLYFTLFEKSGLKPAFFVLGLFLTSMVGISQDSNKYLKSLKQENGSLYFILPTEIKGKSLKINLDITLLYNKDSVNNVFLKFTTSSKQPLSKLDSVQLNFVEKHIKSTAHKLYFLEKKGKNWKSRFEAIISFEDFIALLKNYNSLQSIDLFVESEGEQLNLEANKLKRLIESLSICSPIILTELKQ